MSNEKDTKTITLVQDREGSTPLSHQPRVYREDGYRPGQREERGHQPGAGHVPAHGSGIDLSKLKPLNVPTSTPPQNGTKKNEK